jgi:hypothetical protein
MALAEVFEAVAGPDAPVEFRAYDGSRVGADVDGDIYQAQNPGAENTVTARYSPSIRVSGW